MTGIKTLDSLTRDELRSLAEMKGGPTVSIYHPTDRAAPKFEQNALHLKNLLGRAERRLDERGLRRRDIEGLLAPARRLLGHHDFWQHQLDGLAVFCGPDLFRCYRLPFHVGETVAVDDSLYLKPLLPALAGEGSFYVLAVSQNRIRLMRGNRYRMEVVDIDDLDIPKNLAESLRYDDLQKGELQHHPTTGPGREPPSRRISGKGREHVFHGHGQAGDEQKKQVLNYFKRIDTGIAKLLEAERAPLLLAAVEYLHPLYHQASDQHMLIKNGLVGNYDQADAAEIHRQAWPLVEPELRKKLDTAIAKYRSLEGTGRASCDPREVLEAAHSGRVESLFLQAGIDMWGTFDPESQELEVHDEPRPEDVELLDVASKQTIAHSGDTHVLPAEQMPCSEAMGAVYRF
jgi:hypothetical protein